jgi:hypothetical protein
VILLGQHASLDGMDFDPRFTIFRFADYCHKFAVWRDQAMAFFCL